MAIFQPNNTNTLTSNTLLLSNIYINKASTFYTFLPDIQFTSSSKGVTIKQGQMSRSSTAFQVNKNKTKTVKLREEGDIEKY